MGKRAEGGGEFDSPLPAFSEDLLAPVVCWALGTVSGVWRRCRKEAWHSHSDGGLVHLLRQNEKRSWNRAKPAKVKILLLRGKKPPKKSRNR